MGGRVGGAPQRARRPGDRPRPAGGGRPDGRRPSRRPHDRRREPAAAARPSSSSRTTTRRGRRSSASCARRGYRIDEARRRPHGAAALGERAGRTSSCSTSACPTWTASTIVRRIRREATTPIVILSGRYEEREKVEALERGADDYVTKPFGVDELNARLRVALRHAAGPAADAGRPDRRRAARARRRPPRGPRRRQRASTSRRASSRSCASC